MVSASRCRDREGLLLEQTTDACASVGGDGSRGAAFRRSRNALPCCTCVACFASQVARVYYRSSICKQGPEHTYVTSSICTRNQPSPRACNTRRKMPPCVVVQTARRLVEDFYRSKGIEPTLLPPPSSAIAAAAAAGRPGGVAPRVRLPDPMMPTDAMIGHLGRGRTMAVAGPAAAGMRTPSGAIPQGARPVAQPVMYGGGHGGGGGGGVDVSGGELPQLLRAARCEHHLERFQRDQLDGEVLLEMERRDFDRMGVTEVCVCAFCFEAGTLGVSVIRAFVVSVGVHVVIVIVGLIVRLVFVLLWFS